MILSLVEMYTCILLVESQIIWSRIRGFKFLKYPQVRIESENAQGAMRMMRLARVYNASQSSNG